MTALALVSLGYLFARPVLAAGGFGAGGLILYHQWRFVRESANLKRELTPRVRVDRRRVRAGDSVRVTLDVPRTETPLDATVEVPLPVGTDGPPSDDRSVSVDSEAVSITFSVRCEVVGPTAFGAPSVVVDSVSGLFTTTIHCGGSEDVRVVPRGRPTVGEGGGEEGSTSPEKDGKMHERGTDVDVVELREHVSGDPVSDVDWKATARLNELYVRKNRRSRAYPVTLVFDRRTGSAGDGRGRLDALREVALAAVDRFEAEQDPVELYVVDDDGVAGVHDTRHSSVDHRQLKQRLYELSPTEVERRTEPHSTGHNPRIGDAPDSQFGRTLRPYVTSRTVSTDSTDTDPLSSAVERMYASGGQTAGFLLFSDDRDRTGLRDTVETVRGDVEDVTLFLFPRALSGDVSLATVDDVYDRYRNFEQFQQSLSSIAGVTAVEVTPDERLQALLGGEDRSS